MSEENLKKMKELPRDMLEDLVISLWDEVNEGIVLEKHEYTQREEKLEQEIKKLEADYCSLQAEFRQILVDSEILTRENDTLKEKLNTLIEAFNKVIDKPKDVFKDLIQTEKKSPEKTWREKELASPQWKRKREKVFEKYGRQCVLCGKTHNLQIHHLVYRKGRHIWEYDDDELIPLCKKCHNKVHKDKSHKFHEKKLC